MIYISKFCPHCGKKQRIDSGRFCEKCGKQLVDSNVNINQNQNSFNQNMNNLYIAEEKHTAAIILGYLFTFLFFFIPILAQIIGLIYGIYLVSRDNKKVHVHGIIMLVFSIIILIFWLFYLNRPRYYYHHHYY